MPSPMFASMPQGVSGTSNSHEQPIRDRGMLARETARMLLRGRGKKDPRKNIVRGDASNDGMMGAAGGP